MNGDPRPGTVFAHRWSMAFVFGPDVLFRLTADHRCRRRACTNPLHSIPLSHAENVARGNRLRHLDPEESVFSDPFAALGV